MASSIISPFFKTLQNANLKDFKDDYDALNSTSSFNCFIEIIPATILVSRKSCGLIFYRACVTYLPKIQMAQKHVH